VILGTFVLQELLTRSNIFVLPVNTALKEQNIHWIALVVSTNHSSVKLIVSCVRLAKCALGKSNKTVPYTTTVKRAQHVTTMM